MSTSEPQPFDPRHIVFGERMVNAWMQKNRSEALKVFDEILRGPCDLAIVAEYLVGTVAVERILRLGLDEAIAETQAVIAELSDDVEPAEAATDVELSSDVDAHRARKPRLRLIRVKQYGAAG